MSGGLTQIKHRGQHPYKHSSAEIKHTGYASLKEAVDAALAGGVNEDDIVIPEGKSIFFGTDPTRDATVSYNPNSPFGGNNGILEIEPEGDLAFRVGGSLAGTAVVFYRAKTGSNKHLRFVARADRSGGQCSMELGEINVSTGYFRYDGNFDQLALFLTTACGNQVVLASALNRTRDQDVAIQTDMALVVKSALNPNTDNAETILLNYKGLFAGQIDNADPLLASREMETDREAFDIHCYAPNANSGAVNNTAGGNVKLKAGRGTTTEEDGKVQVETNLETKEGRNVNIKRITFADSPYDILTTDDRLFVDTDGGAVVMNLQQGS